MDHSLQRTKRKATAEIYETQSHETRRDNTLHYHSKPVEASKLEETMVNIAKDMNQTLSSDAQHLLAEVVTSFLADMASQCATLQDNQASTSPNTPVTVSVTLDTLSTIVADHPEMVKKIDNIRATNLAMKRK